MAILLRRRAVSAGVPVPRRYCASNRASQPHFQGRPFSSRGNFLSKISRAGSVFLFVAIAAHPVTAQIGVEKGVARHLQDGAEFDGAADGLA